MWMTELSGQMPPPLRHWCDQGDGLESYTWLVHDGTSFGVQELQEKLYLVKTEFVKQPGGHHGGDWTARIHFLPKEPQSSGVVVSSFFYAALESNNGQLEPEVVKGQLSSVRGWSQELGGFRLKFVAPDGASRKESYLVSHASQLDQLKEVLVAGLKVDAWDKARTIPYFKLAGRRLPQGVGQPNLVVKQVTAQLPFSVELVYQSSSFDQRAEELSGQVLTAILQHKLQQFQDKFHKLFRLKEKGYSDLEQKFAQAALSNMLGSVGYFYGSSLVQSSYTKEPVKYWEAPLYTGVPSRPFFPRGFLWDEGFHNLLIAAWDEEMSKEIIGHWLDLMNVEGWIPREQILGDEARAKVPAQFVVQRNSNANPPTFFLPLQGLVRSMVNSSAASDMAYLSALYPRLQAWFQYYNTSQAGAQAFTYRWHGRDATTTKQLNPLTLTSGLDDYPRASHPTDDERHLDLRCWIALAAGVMRDIAVALGKDGGEYEATYQLLADNKLLDQLHWSARGKQYSDYGLHTDKARLEKPKHVQTAHRPPTNVDPDKVRVVLSEPTYQFVDAFGYVSLFPMLLGLVEPDSPKLQQILTDLTDRDKLWTDFGLRSISRKSKFYGRFNTEHDPPYWRGPIWVNMNYLCLSALKHYSTAPGPYQHLAQDVYTRLRTNLVSNMFREFQRTGYIWENYSDSNGQGRGSHPFTGWSALVVLIMSERY
ncbi:mannosyl-oligosaccharide glucosidase-like isoform X2 [Physella acuta]|nr:mannosyl-oligosaccharide glucosidase-like isoform X2 [Physella acuta]